MKIAAREKYFIAAGAGVIIVILFLQILVFPFIENKKKLQRGIAAKEAALKEVVMLRSEYQALKQNSSGVEQMLAARPKDFTLFSFLETAADKSAVNLNIKYMKPSESEGTGTFKESLVEMKLEQVSLPRLIEFLLLIESDKDVVSIKRVSIQENKKEAGSLDATLQVMTYH